METVGNCLNKLTGYSLKDDTTVTKARIVYNLGRLVEIKGTPNFDVAVNFTCKLV